MLDSFDNTGSITGIPEYSQYGIVPGHRPGDFVEREAVYDDTKPRRRTRGGFYHQQPEI